MASFSAIQKFAEEYKSSHTKLDILVNNAGLVSPPITKTEQGIESTTGINYLGHFFLTHLLKDLIIPVKGRVVVVASNAYKGYKITQDMMAGSKPMIFEPVPSPGWTEYSRSNTCRVLFAKELTEKYPELTSVSLHPGVIKTNLARSGSCCSVMNCILFCFGCCLKSPVEGAQTTLHCATADMSGCEGMYFVDSKLDPILEGYASEDLQKRLWEISMAVVDDFLNN